MGGSGAISGLKSLQASSRCPSGFVSYFLTDEGLYERFSWSGSEPSQRQGLYQTAIHQENSWNRR